MNITDVVLCSDELALERAHMYHARTPAQLRELAAHASAAADWLEGRR